MKLNKLLVRSFNVRFFCGLIELIYSNNQIFCKSPKMVSRIARKANSNIKHFLDDSLGKVKIFIFSGLHSLKIFDINFK